MCRLATSISFFFQVNDMTTLNYKQSYIACSADMILKTKGETFKTILYPYE